MQDAFDQFKDWNRSKRAPYEARVTIAETIPAIAPNGRSCQSSPTSSSRLAIVSTTYVGIFSTYAWRNSQINCLRGPLPKSSVCDTASCANLYAAWESGTASPRNRAPPRTGEETKHRRQRTPGRSERLEHGAPHGAVFRVERGATRLEILIPPRFGAVGLVDLLGIFGA